MGDDQIWVDKQAFKYNFWTRSAIDYNQDSCPVSISGASDKLKEMENAHGKRDLTNAVKWFAIVLAGISLFCCF